MGNLSDLLKGKQTLKESSLLGKTDKPVSVSQTQLARQAVGEIKPKRRLSDIIKEASQQPTPEMGTSPLLDRVRQQRTQEPTFKELIQKAKEVRGQIVPTVGGVSPAYKDRPQDIPVVSKDKTAFEQVKSVQAERDREMMAKDPVRLISEGSAERIGTSLSKLPNWARIPAETLQSGLAALPFVASDEARAKLREPQLTAFKTPEVNLGKLKIPSMDVKTGDIGSVATQLGVTGAQYKLVGNALDKLGKGSKVLALLNSNPASKFATTQAADLLVDTIVQSPKEVLEAIEEDKSFGEFGSDFLNARKWDIVINGIMGGVIDGPKMFRQIQDSIQTGKNAKVLANVLEEGKVAVKNMPDGAVKQAIEKELSAKDFMKDISSFEATVKPIKNVDIDGSVYKIVEEQGNNYKAIDAFGDETFIPKVIADEGTVLDVAEYTARQQADKILMESSQSMKGESYKEGYLKSDLIDGGTQLGETGDFVPALGKVQSKNVQDLLNRNFASSEPALRNRLERIAKGNATEADKPLKEYLEVQAAKIDDFVPTTKVDVPPQAAKIEDGSIKETFRLDDGPRTQDGLKERGFSRNIRTDEAIAKEANASFDKDPEFYKELANQTTLQKAQTRFAQGYEEALKDFELTKGDFTPDNVVLAKLIANEAAVRGDLTTMRRVLSDTAETLTSAGQYSQAARILRESNDPATIMQYLNKEIKKLNTQGRKRYGTLKNKLIGKGQKGWKDIVLTDEAIAKEANASFDKDPEFYKELTNQTTLQKAQTRFAQGYEEALKDFELTKGDFTPDNVVLAKLIANEAAVRGDLTTMRRVLSDTAETLTSAGQYSQAARILRESNDPATIMQYLNKEIKKLNTQGRKRYGTLKNKLIGKGQKGWNDIVLTDEEIKLVTDMTKRATDAEKQQVFEQIYESIAKRIPTTKREKFDAWRRISMLTNPKTHVRNILGNTLMTGVKKVSDTIATGLEKALVPKLERTKSVISSKANKQIANDYFNANKKELLDGSRWEIFGVKSPFADKKVFDNKALEAINNFSKATLDVEDKVFMKHHFTKDLAGFMQARGLTEPTDEAVKYALRRAQEATFRQQNALADMIAKGKKSRYGLLVEAAVPFSKTPANIAQMGLDYSPIGVVKSIGELLTNAPPATVVETLSKGLTGTSLAALGYYLSKNGMARGDYKADPEEEALFGRMGILPNSIIFKNGSYGIDWAQPAAIPLFMGIAFEEAMSDKDDDGTIVDATWDALIKGGDTIINQTMLSGIKDVFGGYGSTTEKIAELPLNYLTQAFPTMAGQIARSVDPVKRERDYSGILPKLKTQTTAKTPVLSKTLAPKRGIFGEELKYGDGASNILQQFLSPGYFSKGSGDALTNELFRLYNEVGSNFLPRAKVTKINGIKLTPQEKSDFQKTMGEYTQARLERLINSSAYKNETDEEKAKAIKKVNDDGRELAKEEFLKGR